MYCRILRWASRFIFEKTDSTHFWIHSRILKINKGYCVRFATAHINFCSVRYGQPLHKGRAWRVGFENRVIAINRDCTEGGPRRRSNYRALSRRLTKLRHRVAPRRIRLYSSTERKRDEDANGETARANGNKKPEIGYDSFLKLSNCIVPKNVINKCSCYKQKVWSCIDKIQRKLSWQLFGLKWSFCLMK